MNTSTDVVEVYRLPDTSTQISLDEALVKYEPMVHYFVKGAKTNHVCNEEDLCQEGRLAIVLAYKKYDPSAKASLTTWTYHMIRAAIAEYQKTQLSILAGGHHLQTILKKAGKDASVKEIMEMGVTRKTAISATYFQNSFAGVDFDALSGCIGEEDVPSVEVGSLNWRDYLNETEIDIIEKYYGFKGKKMSIKEVGEQTGRSRKSVAYVINTALAKLRHIPNIEEYFYGTYT